MATTTLSDNSTRRWHLAIIASAVAVVAGLTLAMIVAAALVLAPAGAQDVQAPTLGQTDDYYLRHATGAAPFKLGSMDDYGLRHPAVNVAPGPLDDYGLRHPARR